jgi:AcrR family transcriptional regulator
VKARSSVRGRGRPRVGKQPGRDQAIAALLDAAEDTLATRGPDATMAAIARRAGVAVGTLYNYFPDRDALLASLFRARREELVPSLVEAAREAQRQPFERRMAAYIAATLAIFDRHRRFIQVVVAVDQTHVKVKDRRPAVLAAMTDAVVDILLAVSPDNADAKARMIVGAMKGLVHWRVERGEPFTGDAELLADTFLRGIAR